MTVALAGVAPRSSSPIGGRAEILPLHCWLHRVQGATPATDSVLVSAGAELRFRNGVVLSGKFDASSP
jgi:hypothetical protein